MDATTLVWPASMIAACQPSSTFVVMGQMAKRMDTSEVGMDSRQADGVIDDLD